MPRIGTHSCSCFTRNIDKKISNDRLSIVLSVKSEFLHFVKALQIVISHLIKLMILVKRFLSHRPNY